MPPLLHEQHPLWEHTVKRDLCDQSGRANNHKPERSRGPWEIQVDAITGGERNRRARRPYGRTFRSWIRASRVRNPSELQLAAESTVEVRARGQC